ncbi:MAG: 23S rRNA (guanosine(2251)-2'-O)-methyltransferase RlmB [Erysipelotrichaceae bacterium]|jgi:23S rRNA (guanosine2251-2'-O)-methyltransferase|nr:23S rRNA (guanosine(2251)-2'-O)-methyltransferase RlmB [Erysipelotrichaceae bacterium]
MVSLIYGRNTVRDSLVSSKVKSIYISASFSDKKLLAIAEKEGVKIQVVSNQKLDSLINANHQGIVAEIERFEYFSIDDIIREARKKTRPVILLLDGINDPGNFGAILRSADAFGVSGIIIKKHGQVMLNATVAKTSTGAINHVKVAMTANLSQAMERLKEEGFWIVSTDGEAKTNYQDLKYDFPVGLIIGSEGEGISPLLIKRSDFVVKIPMFGHVNSLNASVAAGILLSYINLK